MRNFLIWYTLNNKVEIIVLRKLLVMLKIESIEKFEIEKKKKEK